MRLPEENDANFQDSHGDYHGVDRQLTLPRMAQHSGIDVVYFESSWQVCLLLESPFIHKMAKLIAERDEPYRFVLCMDYIDGLTMLDLGNLVAVFSPFAEDGGKVCLCQLSPSVDQLVRINRLDCVFLIAQDISEAIDWLTSD